MAKEIVNSYAQQCHYCSTIVDALMGAVWRDMHSKRWCARHAHCGMEQEARDNRMRVAENLTVTAGTTEYRQISAEEGAAEVHVHSDGRVVGGIAKAAIEAKREDRNSEDTSELMEKLAEAGLTPEAEELSKRMERALELAVENMAGEMADVFNATVPGMVAELLTEARPIEIKVGKLPAVKVDKSHKALTDILVAVSAGGSPFLVGPAGSGKTTLAQQVADVLKRTFYMSSRVSSEYKLTGFINAQGEYVRTQFRDAFELGGVFLFDEVDASDPDALTAFNSALACPPGKKSDFPDGMVTRHKDFIALAAGNTFGRGADRQYVGRNQLDAATLDRFQVFEVDYDEALEKQLAGNASWVAYVQAVRKALADDKVRHVVSPRASITGARMLSAGLAMEKVIDACIFKGIDPSVRGRVEAKCVTQRAAIVWDVSEEGDEL